MDTSEWRIWCVLYLSYSLSVLWRTVLFSQLANPRVKAQALDLEILQEIVKADSKQRYDLVLEGLDSGVGEWWIRANQGHSIQV
jgi:RNA:NAD 2'-phosphotransferase (TPT1/KptA family)